MAHPSDYRDDRFGDHAHDVTGDTDLLNLTRPEVIRTRFTSFDW